MCGIAGFVGAPSEAPQLESIASAMADAIRHRGPDDAGTWVDSAHGVALAHRRLAVIDLSPAGHQPMISGSGRFVISFNGEIYNHLDLRRELRGGSSSSGAAPWHGRSDTETLLACIEAYGLRSTLDKISGMFAIAVWDRATQTLCLARDRGGEKPLYYGWQDGVFLFGSELSALRRHPSFRAGVDRDAVSLLLKHNYVPAPYSIHVGISKLQPGCLLQLATCGRRTNGTPANDVAITEYFSMLEAFNTGLEHPFRGTEDEAIEQLGVVLSKAVRSQAVADVPLGALLSGGVDSSLVTALMQRSSERPVRTFTVGFDVAEYDEASHAREVARHLGTEHTEFRLTGRDALALVPRLPEIYDEPFADSSQLPTQLVMRMAREHVTVALSGDAADELFGGYNRYVLVPKVVRRTHWLPEWSKRALAHAMLAVPSSAMNRWSAPLGRRFGVTQLGDKAHKLAHRLQHSGSVNDLYLSLVSEWLAEPSVVTGAVPDTLLTQVPRWSGISDEVGRMMALDAANYLPDDILAKVDRAAMSVSLETRTPYLDPDVIRFAWSLPRDMKVRGGTGKWLLRQLLDRLLPPELTRRPKMGFGIPLDSWLRGPLRPWAEELLSEARLRREGHFDPRIVRQTWEAHLAGRRSYGYRLWSVLMFQAWLDWMR